MIFPLISCLFLIVAIVCFLHLTPKQIAEDVLELTVKEPTLRDQVRALRTGKQKKSIGQRLLYTQDALTAMGKENKFALIICASLVLFVVGAVLAILLGNVFLVPSFAAFLAVAPFIYVRSSLAQYEKHIAQELETTLSIISTSYVRNSDIILAVKENLGYLKPPLKEHFTAFVNDATYVSDTRQALRNLRSKIKDEVFYEWIDAVLQCQGDSTLRETLQPIVQKLSDIRIVNSELSALMASARMEYYTMVGLVVGNIPLLYVLNKDWFHTLLYETPGKIVLGICGAVIFVTYLFMLKFTKPVQYKA